MRCTSFVKMTHTRTESESAKTEANSIECKRPWELYNNFLNEGRLRHCGKIPKIIHQTWKTNDIPEEWKFTPEEWKYFHPDWLYLLWTDDDIEEFINLFHPDYMGIFSDFKYGIQRADAMRYFVLYDYGGVYSDLDILPKRNIEEFIKNGSDIFFVFSPNLNYFSNFFMISRKGHPLWLRMWEELGKEIPKWAVGKHMEVMCSTGPHMVNRVILDEKYIIGFLPRRLFAPVSVEDDSSKIDTDESVIVMLPGQSWCEMDSKIYNFFFKHRVKLIVLAFLLSVLLWIRSTFSSSTRMTIHFPSKSLIPPP